MLASLAITDNEDRTVAKVGKMNPWHIQALTLITGSEERAHRRLSDILYDDMDGLVLDTLVDVSGLTKGGHFLDTQGYIAHNDDIVVVSFRCTTTIFDWMTNFNSSSSVWEVETDLQQGFSGFCSGYEGLCCVDNSQYRPRVHTGFYNNFLAAWPTIEQHVGPYLSVNERHRKLYVVGHSLGAGIANLTASHFLLKYNWTELPQDMVLVTAGSPRSICKSMKSIIDEELERHGPTNVRFHRIVKGRDAVATVPPKFLGFDHMTLPIIIQDDGDIVFECDDDGPNDRENDPTRTATMIAKKFTQLKDEQDLAVLSVAESTYGKEDGRDDNDENDSVASPTCDDDSDHDPESDPGQKTKTKYDKLVERIPKALRDHMPDFYLKPIFKARGIEHGSSRPIPDNKTTQSATDIGTKGEDDSGQINKLTTCSNEPKMMSGKKKRWISLVFRGKR